MHVDCGEALAMPLQAVGPIDVNGFTQLAVNPDTDETALVRLIIYVADNLSITQHMAIVLRLICSGWFSVATLDQSPAVNCL